MLLHHGRKFSSKNINAPSWKEALKYEQHFAPKKNNAPSQRDIFEVRTT
jgi:hypothetical protein